MRTAKPVILIDSREQATLRFSAAVDVEVVTLPVGDYSIAGSTDTVSLERKRLGELATCCGTYRERFIEQVERCVSTPCAHSSLRPISMVCGRRR